MNNQNNVSIKLGRFVPQSIGRLIRLYVNLVPLIFLLLFSFLNVISRPLLGYDVWDRWPVLMFIAVLGLPLVIVYALYYALQLLLNMRINYLIEASREADKNIVRLTEELRQQIKKDEIGIN